MSLHFVTAPPILPRTNIILEFLTLVELTILQVTWLLTWRKIKKLIQIWQILSKINVILVWIRLWPILLGVVPLSCSVTLGSLCPYLASLCPVFLMYFSSQAVILPTSCCFYPISKTVKGLWNTSGKNTKITSNKQGI